MHVGLTTYPVAESMHPGELAAAAEARGFESIFLPEHTHIPVARVTPYPNGGELPDVYRRGLDPFIALTAMAAATTTLRLGTAVCLVAEHDPIVLAKVIATLDHLSGGRIEFGVGAGWNREAMRNHGTDPNTRWTLMRERVQAMRAIWTCGEAEYHGEMVSFDPIWSWPKPVQPCGPPVLIGGGRAALQRVLDYGDGWIPPMGWVDELEVSIAELRRQEAERGLQPRSITVVGIKPKPEVLDQLRSLGVDRAVISVPPAGADVVMPLLDRYARLIA